MSWRSCWNFGRAASPTGATLNSKLLENYGLLSRCLVVSPSLLFKLRSVEYLRDKVPKIRQLATAEQKVTELLNILDEVPDSQQQSVFCTLLTALRQDGQEHVANIFLPESDARPMSDEHYQLLVSKQQQVCQCLDPLSGLVDELVDQNVFNDKDINNIMDINGFDQKSFEVIKIIRRKPDSSFDSFISALVTSKQEHVASLLGYRTTEIPMTDEHRQLLVSKKEELSHFINPTRTLLNKLEAADVLNKKDIDSIVSKSNDTDMSTELVNILVRKSDCSFDKFIEALNSTEQQPVVHILTGQGESPLSHLRRLVLRKARKKLVSKVDTMCTSLLVELISNGVLTDDDKQRIEVHNVNEIRTAELIDVIVRKSQLAYDKLLLALKDSGHRQVAEELEGLELRGKVDPQFFSDALASPSLVRYRIVRVLRNNMQALVSGKGTEICELTSLMEQNGFAVSEISEGSIHIRFRCFTTKSLENLKRLYSDKTLDKLFTQVFCPQFASQGLESLSLYIMENEFQKLAETFRQIKLFDRPQTTLREQLPVLSVELLELVLMRTFMELFNYHYKKQYKTHVATQVAYSTLAGVCYNWWQTMNGWPQSTTKHWFKHKLHRALTLVCRPYVVSPRLQSSLSVPGSVYGVTVCDNKLFVVCRHSNSILVFGPSNKQQTDIELEQLKDPRDIVSCTETQQLYVADWSSDCRCVWRVSLDGYQVVKWLPNKSTTTTTQFKPWTLSVTSRRLLVTSYDNNELLLYGADGVLLKCVQLPKNDMTSLEHAVETLRGTFIVSHNIPQPRVCEVNVDGHATVTRVFCDQQQLSNPVYLSLDSDGRIFVGDYNKGHILLLNSETLKLERVLLDKKQHQLTRYPQRLCYIEQTRQLAVGGGEFDESTHQFVQLFTAR